MNPDFPVLLVETPPGTAWQRPAWKNSGPRSAGRA